MSTDVSTLNLSENSDGMVALNNIFNDLREDKDMDKFIESLKIYDDKKKSYSITEFMSILSKHKVRMG